MASVTEGWESMSNIRNTGKKEMNQVEGGMAPLSRIDVVLDECLEATTNLNGVLSDLEDKLEIILQPEPSGVEELASESWLRNPEDSVMMKTMVDLKRKIELTTDRVRTLLKRTQL